MYRKSLCSSRPRGEVATGLSNGMFASLTLLEHIRLLSCPGLQLVTADNRSPVNYETGYAGREVIPSGV